MCQVVNFTVSMWNRFEHLHLLLDDLYHVRQLDPRIALHVCAFEGQDATISELRRAVDGAPCTSVLLYRTDEFGNGLGHNTATGGVPRDDIVCNVAVDAHLPCDITQRIRANVAEGKAVYYPLMFQQCQNGRLETRGGGGALMAMFKSDWHRIGGFHPPRTPWGGGAKLSGAEDIHWEKRVAEVGLKINRPKEQDLYCRWHVRSLANPFYRTLKGRNKRKLPPWMNVVDK